MRVEVDPILEKQIIAQAAEDPVFRTKAKGILNGTPFSDRGMMWIWTTIIGAPANEPIPREVIEAKASMAFGGDPDKLEKHELLIAQVWAHVGSAETSLECLEEVQSYIKLEQGALQAAKLLEDGDLEKAWEIISRLKRVDSGAASHVRYIESWEARQEARALAASAHHQYIPTRIKYLDEIIDGIQLSEFGLIAGTTGRGKSIIATNVGFSSAVQGFPTAIFSTEMLADQVSTRIDSRMTRIPYRRFKRYDFSRADEARLNEMIARRKKQLKDKLHVFDAPIGRCDTSFIEEKLVDLDSEGIKIACVIVDSPDHFQSMRRYDQKRHEQATVFWALKGLARGEGALTRRMAVWATTQAPQEFEHKVAGTRGVSETYDKARIADIMLTLNQTADQEKTGEMILNLAKYRDGETRRRIRLMTRFKTMSFIELGIEDDAEAVDKSKLVED